MRLSDCFPESYIVADIETTGLDARRDRIIEVAYIYVENRTPRQTVSRLINPHYPEKTFTVPREITCLTGITSEDVNTGDSPYDVISDFTSKIPGKHVYFHNGFRFDIPFIETEAFRVGAAYPLNPSYLDTAALYKAYKMDILSWIEDYDTFEEFAHAVLSLRAKGVKYSIKHCCSEMGIDIKEAGNLHRAATDAYLTHRIVEALRKILIEGEDDQREKV